MRDTLRIEAPPRRAPGEEVRSELARLRQERDEAVEAAKQAGRLVLVLEAVACVAIAVMFWFAVTQ